ncbi:MAG: response regulator [Magnetococcales bacterium]|nr:response regulator [Magnetococcales bacterium]
MEGNDRILVVEDDEETRTLLRDYLERNGFRCTTARDGPAMRAELVRGAPDLVVLDLMLPGEDGLTLCRTLRADPVTANLPVIMLTARAEETDRIVGLEMGADDYLPKPFNPRELLARVKSVLRRARATPLSRAPQEPKGFRFGGWTLDLAARRLNTPDGVLVPLSRSEFLLLRIFIAHPRQVLDRDKIMTLYKGREADPDDRGIDVQVGRLRKRLADGLSEEVIRTVWGQGYMMDVDVDPWF